MMCILWQVHPKLLETIKKIHCRKILLASKREEMLFNFKLSVRGSIRKAPNIMPLVSPDVVRFFLCYVFV